MKTQITSIILSTLIGIFGTQLSFGENATKDKFTQSDMKVALLLKNLHYYYLAIDDRVSKGQNRKDAINNFSYPIAVIEKQIQEKVGFTVMVDYLDHELKELKDIGLGTEHPQILWIERLLKGLRPKVK